jgi:hypothetical protein
VKIIRVFPRKTNATPIDENTYIGDPTLFAGADIVHISVVFSWDLPEAERLEKEWRQVAPVLVGGPATGQKGKDFTPGMYLKKGYVITSRGCPNRCWFCGVWRREGSTIRELPITEGWNILDDNLLACSESHIREVFSMVAKQKYHPTFSGGLEAKRLQKWHVEEMLKLKPDQMFFAYDTPDDKEPLFAAGKLFRENGFTRKGHTLRAYVLVGYPGDTFEKAEKRLYETMEAGFLPFAMLYRDKSGERDPAWIRFSWPWALGKTVAAKYKIFREKTKEFYTAD